MSSSEEIRNLEEGIKSDEEALKSLAEQESMLLEGVRGTGFLTASRREVILSERQLIEDRLHKTRKMLAVLTR